MTTPCCNGLPSLNEQQSMWMGRVVKETDDKSLTSPFPLDFLVLCDVDVDADESQLNISFVRKDEESFEVRRGDGNEVTRFVFCPLYVIHTVKEEKIYSRFCRLMY